MMRVAKFRAAFQHGIASSGFPGLAVHELVARQAARTPEAVALDDGTSVVTYAELHRRSTDLARCLARRGVRPGATVGVLLERGPEMIETFLAIWTLGAAYVPLDPVFPAKRLRYMLVDSGARLVVTRESLSCALRSETGIQLLILDGLREPLSSDDPSVLPVPVGLDAIAYVVYTSGSSGRPKGVMITHRGLRAYLNWAIDAYASAGTHGAALFASCAFDLVIPVIYAPLMTGQRLRLLPEGLDLSRLGELLAAAGPFTFLKLTPGHFELLTDQLTAEQAVGLAEVIVVAGGSFPAALRDRWRVLAGHRGPLLVNEYGPTEITVGNTAYPLDEGEDTGVLPIGRPIPGTTAYVMDRDGVPLPAGVCGELYVGGDGVALGYRNLPAMTASSFLPDPFAGTPGARMYRTGDLVRARPDGVLDFLGRADGQLELSGYRIEPGEIAAVLVTHPSIRDAVIAADRPERPSRLIGYVVPGPEGLPDPAELTRYCAAILPPYMVPAVFIPVDILPLNANGKVDITALRSTRLPDSEAVGTDACTGTLDDVVSAIFRMVLGDDHSSSVTRDFFGLGGTSLMASRLAARLGARFGLSVPLRVVFENPTVRELAQYISTRLEQEIAELPEDAVIALTASERKA